MAYQPPKHNRYQLFAGYLTKGGLGAETFIDYLSPEEAKLKVLGKGKYHWGQLVEWRFGRPVVVAEWDVQHRKWEWLEEEARTG